MSELLIIDDDVASCRTLQLHFRGQGHDVRTAHNVDSGLEAARELQPDTIILDIRMPGRDGLEGLPDFKQLSPGCPVIMITAFHDMESTIKAMQQGADDYIHKPIDIGELDEAVTRALMRVHAGENNLSLSSDDSPRSVTSMVGRSTQMKEIFKTIGRVAHKPVTVLITGESGTGKELIARAIHRAGSERTRPFVAVNCAALVETLLESDLFGHEKGAFTGAVNKHIGKFAIAENGTMFLDEVSDLSANVQAKLLRVLQEKEFIPLGARESQQTNARVIAATNVELPDLVRLGQFREDLLYRLQVVTIHVPPLRERREDLRELVQVLLGRINREMNRKISRVSMDIMNAFYAYHWPGNVRELENVLMKAVALCPGDLITRELIPDEIFSGGPEEVSYDKPDTTRSLEEVERGHVLRVLNSNAWHRGRACEILGVSRPRLRRMIRQYGLHPPTGFDPGEPEPVDVEADGIQVDK